MNINSYLNCILNNSDGENVAEAFINAADILNTDNLVDITPEKAVVSSGVIGKTLRRCMARILFLLSQYTPNKKISILSQEEYDSEPMIFNNVMYFIRKPDAVLLIGLDEYSNYDPSKAAYVTNNGADWVTVESKLRYVMNAYQHTGLYVGSEYDLDQIHNHFFEDTNLARVKIDLSSYSIKGSAFRNCTELRSIDLGRGVTEISDTAFSGCQNVAIIINKPEGSIEGAPWGAENSNVIWLG